MIRKKEEYTPEKRVIAGGVGEVEFRHKFTPEDTFGKCRICAEITLLPGQSVGEHPHGPDAEIYYMLSGKLISINADKSEAPFEAGDIMITGGGGCHAVRNDSDAPATMLAIVIY